MILSYGQMMCTPARTSPADVFAAAFAWLRARVLYLTSRVLYNRPSCDDVNAYDSRCLQKIFVRTYVRTDTYYCKEGSGCILRVSLTARYTYTDLPRPTASMWSASLPCSVSRQDFVVPPRLCTALTSSDVIQLLFLYG